MIFGGGILFSIIFCDPKSKLLITENDMHLIPKYIAGAPRDPFDNKGVRYSAEKKIIYSVGKKGVDVGGSEGNFNDMENPTVKIGF